MLLQGLPGQGSCVMYGHAERFGAQAFNSVLAVQVNYKERLEGA